MDGEHVVGVSHGFVDGKPRILVAFYLDSGDIIQTDDDEGRPIALASFDPEAAYVTLVDKIIEARESLQKIARGGGEYVKPYLSIATLCERRLEEKDNVVSLIRLVDVFLVDMDIEPEAGTKLATPVVAFLQFRGGPDEFVADVRVVGPAGQEVSHASIPIRLAGGAAGFNLTVSMPVVIEGEGTYGIEVSRGAERLVKLPFQLKRKSRPEVPPTEKK